MYRPASAGSGLGLAALGLAFALLAPVPGITRVAIDESTTGGEIQAELADGLPIALVYVHLLRSTGDRQEDDELKRRVADAFGMRKGGVFRPIVAAFALKRVQQLASVEAAELRLYRTVPSGQVAVAMLVSPREQAGSRPEGAKGMMATGDLGAFPTILEDDRSKFVFILNGGAGVFSDADPWFGGYGEAFNGGNPTAEDPAGAGTTTWAEGYVEPGIGGISQIGDSPVYPYGAVSYLVSGTAGQDIYNSDSRTYGDFEKLYAGLIWDLPGEDAFLDLSIGRQVYQIRDGFLLSKIPVSTSIGERAALYLGPRLTSENTVLLRGKSADFGLDAFLIEPSELDEIATDTRLAGINLQYQFGRAEAAFTYFYVPASKSSYRSPDGARLPREGLRTFNPSLSIKRVFGMEGAWLKAEYAHQDHEDFDMSADAGYVWIGYQAQDVRWKPALSYRWSTFSGDDPDTETFERFDPLFSGGLGNFLPGIVFSKVYKNANLVTNRFALSVKPSPHTELLLDYFVHRADDLNNRGGIGPLQILGSKDIGEEVTLTGYHYIGNNFFLQGVTSVGFPGKAIEEALGGEAENWYTVQAALYVFF